MKDLYDRGENIDRLTIVEELQKQGQLESVDGLSYLISLDEGLRNSQTWTAIFGSSRRSYFYQRATFGAE